MSTKMKGLLKGLRYISHIFEEEEKEMQIGLPTDVKHVAHIGWDGPSVSSPTWMNEFKSSPAPESASAPLQLNGNANGQPEDVNWVSQDSMISKKSIKDSPSRDLPSLPKASRRQSSMDSIGSIDSPLGSPTQKSKSSRRRQSRHKECSSPKAGESSNNSHGAPNIPKKARRKKSKDGDGSLKSSSKSKEKGSRHGSSHGSDDGTVSKQYSGEVCSSPSYGALKEEEVKG